jgi:2-dehydro-3-deoxyphosphogluconate aldolase/(4S)-4-hydroxy-2-oxoglutarate aldolase
MPTGGVSPNEESIGAWFKAGVTCVGMGSQLIKKNGNGDYDLAEISRLVALSLAIIQRASK